MVEADAPIRLPRPVPTPIAPLRPVAAPAGAALARPRADVGPPPPRADDAAAARLGAAVAARPVGAPPAAERAYGVAAYLTAEGLRAPAAGEAVEVTHRRSADGGRLTVARRVAGGRTVALEAQVA